MIKGILRVPDRFGMQKENFYPDSDQEAGGVSTATFEWIAHLKIWLDCVFSPREDVYVSGRQMWFPVEDDRTLRQTVGVMVVFGHPKAPRGSYMQWEEAAVAPQVVFEILSPGNTAAEMDRKFAFYERHGVEEYYKYDPERRQAEGWLRKDGRLQPIANLHGWQSPRLKIRFEMADTGLKLFGQDGAPFLNFVEVARQLKAAGRQLEETGRRMDELARELEKEKRRATDFAKQRDEITKQRDEVTKQRDEAAKQRDQLAARLRALGIDPDQETL